MIHKIFAWLLYLIKILIYKGWKMDKENERVRVLADKLKALAHPARLYMVKNCICMENAISVILWIVCPCHNLVFHSILVS